MNSDKRLENSLNRTESGPSYLTPEDIAALTHYPSLDKLFRDNDLSALSAMKIKLHKTFQDFERVMLRGPKEELERARIAAATVKSALDFLQMLEQMRNDNHPS